MAAGSGPHGKVESEMGIGPSHPQPLSGRRARQRPVQEQVAAPVESERAEVEVRVGTRRR
ncbi:MAG: hypothetical protein WB765_05065 [Acidimicrobiales bacterium]